MEIQLSTAAVHLGTALKYRRGWSKNNIGVEIIREFTKGKGGKASQRYRLYLPIHATRTKVKVPPAILRAVEHAGYVISDYVAGIATQKDGKRVMKIGKLLKDEHLRNTFANDVQRQSHKNEYTCVISCHPYDIIGMSTGRTWDQFSCMRLGAGSKLNPDSNNGDDGAYADTLSHDIKAGTLVAYAVKNSDVDIKNPDARLLIKPYINERQDEVLFRVETKVYGNHVQGFRETIAAFLRKVNANASAGRYSLIKGLYNDGAGYSARHMGPIAHADLNDPAKLEEWVAHADIGDYSEKFKENNEQHVIGILKNADSLYKSYIFNDVVSDLFPEDLEKDDADQRLQIALSRLLDMGNDGKESINRLMDKYLRHWVQESLPKSVLDMLAPLVKYNPEKNYSHGFMGWAWKLNPAVLLQPNGDVNQDYDRFVKAYRAYPLIEPMVLNAARNSTVYQAALAESYVQYAAAQMRHEDTAWRPVDPSMVPNDGFVRGDLRMKIDEMRWSDDQQLFAMSANSQDWFTQDKANLLELAYLEKLTVANLFNLPFIKNLYEHGLGTSPNDTSIGETFADILHRVCLSDPEGVKAEETRMYELAELLGEHDYGTKRYIEKDIERVLYG